jgi:hypothetical protein
LNQAENRNAGGRGAKAPHNKMTCRQFVALISTYRDGELSTAASQSFWHHSRNCVRCSDYLKGYELTVSAVKRIAEDSRDPSESESMPKSLVRKILGNRPKRRSGS